MTTKQCDNNTRPACIKYTKSRQTQNELKHTVNETNETTIYRVYPQVNENCSVQGKTASSQTSSKYKCHMPTIKNCGKSGKHYTYFRKV